MLGDEAIFSIVTRAIGKIASSARMKNLILLAMTVFLHRHTVCQEPERSRGVARLCESLDIVDRLELFVLHRLGMRDEDVDVEIVVFEDLYGSGVIGYF